MSDRADLRVVGEAGAPGLSLPEGIGHEDWRAVGLGLARERRASDIEWRIGDWAGRADGDFATLAEAAGIVGESLGNVKKYVSAAKAWPKVRRRTGVDFHLHLEVAALPEAERERLLEAAGAEGWTRAQMREAVRGARDRELERLQKRLADVETRLAEAEADKAEAEAALRRLEAGIDGWGRTILREWEGDRRCDGGVLRSGEPEGRGGAARQQGGAGGEAAARSPEEAGREDQRGREPGRRASEGRVRTEGARAVTGLAVAAFGLGEDDAPVIQAPCNAVASPMQAPCAGAASPVHDPAARVFHDPGTGEVLADGAAWERAADADRTAASEAGVSVSAVAGWRRRVAGLPEGGRVVALLDGERTGRPSPIDGNAAWRGTLEALAFHHGPHLTAEHARRTLIARHGEAPSLRAVRRWLAGWRGDNARELSAVANPDRHRSHRKPAGGDAAAGIGRLNQVWELDSTICDVICADGRRHALCAAIDVWPRRARVLIAPTSRSAAIAALLRRCILDWGVPEAVRTDEGADYTSRHVLGALADLEIAHDPCPPYTPEAKPFVERFIGTISRDLFAFLPGFAGHDVAQAQALRGRRSFAARRGETPAVTLRASLDAEALQARLRRLVRGGLRPPAPCRARRESPPSPAPPPGAARSAACMTSARWTRCWPSRPARARGSSARRASASTTPAISPKRSGRWWTSACASAATRPIPAVSTSTVRTAPSSAWPRTRRAPARTGPRSPHA